MRSQNWIFATFCSRLGSFFYFKGSSFREKSPLWPFFIQLYPEFCVVFPNSGYVHSFWPSQSFSHVEFDLLLEDFDLNALLCLNKAPKALGIKSRPSWALLLMTRIVKDPGSSSNLTGRKKLKEFFLKFKSAQKVWKVDQFREFYDFLIQLSSFPGDHIPLSLPTSPPIVFQRLLLNSQCTIAAPLVHGSLYSQFFSIN